MKSSEDRKSARGAEVRALFGARRGFGDTRSLGCAGPWTFGWWKRVRTKEAPFGGAPLRFSFACLPHGSHAP